MGQEWIVYSFVARGKVILADHTTLPSNLPSIAGLAAQLLENLPVDPQKRFTTKHGGHTFCFLVEDGYAYSVAATESAGTQQILFEFLERIRQDFKNKYSHGRGDAAVAFSLSEKFGPVMKQQMQWVADHGDDIDKVAKVKAQISEVQITLSDDIDKILQRSHCCILVSHGEPQKIYNSSVKYQKTATRFRRNMWCQNAKTKLIIQGIMLLLLGFVIWVSICNGFNCSNDS